ncbi:hypothetical protein SAMN05421803_11614 [Nocardiopsis flavescens]|uniref:DUF1648 domain-containing protein n=1 Tax=Nocardiopsis flavescens TaxID=758803 RepID=A0A1M6QSY9_9ACTN|nr:hypothetical protein [Nocardiopsis flavescens]SHK23371.1 hypothetical protein SAMN05421803_11614 [Nocardiopsis flavescens]
MRNTTGTGTRPAAEERPRPPFVGMAVAALAVAGMAAVSWAVWPDLAQMVHGGRYNLDGSPNMVPRWLLAVAMPFTSALVAAILGAVPTLTHHLQHSLKLPVGRPPGDTTRAMNALMVLLSLFLLVTHAVVVFNGAGWDFPTARVAGVAVGLLLIGVALVVPGPASAASGLGTAVDRWWADARRPVAFGMAAVGAVQIAVALMVENAILVGSTALLLLPAMGLGMAFPLLKRRRRG